MYELEKSPFSVKQFTINEELTKLNDEINKTKNLG